MSGTDLTRERQSAPRTARITGVARIAHSRSLTQRQRKEALVGYAFAGLGLAWFWLWAVYPLGKSFAMSFTNWRIIGESQFVGFANYLRALSDPVIFISLRNTLVYAVISVPGQMFFALLVAVLLDQRIRGRVFFRLVYYLPVISSWVVVSLMFMYLFHSEGLVNYIFADVLHLLPSHVPWLAQPGTALVTVSILGIWKGIGWSMLIYLAALQGIPREIEEAALIDGAGWWHLLWRVKLPLVRPTTMFILVMLTIGAFQAFIQFYILTNGLAMNEGQVFLSYMYKQAFNFFDFGYAAAISFLLAAMILVISFFQIRYFRGGTLY